MSAALCYAPPKGNPGALRAAAAVWSAMGSELSTLSDQVGAAGSSVAGSWKGAGATAFESASSGHANHLASLAGQSSEMAAVLSRAAQLIEHAQQVYKAQMQRIAAANASHGPSLGAIAGLVGIGAVAAVTQEVPGVDVGVDGALAADAGSVAGDAAVTTAEAAAVAGEVSAASSVIGDAVATLTSGMQAVAQEIAGIAGRFAQTFGKLPMPVQFGIQGGGATAASEEVFNGHVNLGDVAVNTVGSAAGGFLPFGRAIQYGFGSGLGTAAQQTYDTGGINSPVSIAEWTALGAVGGAAEEHVLPPAHAGAQGVISNGVKHGVATASATYVIAHYKPKQ